MSVVTSVLADILWIHTRHSLYEFFVIDPVKMYGVVKGGVLGASAIEAFVCHPTSLMPGRKAQLMIESPKGNRDITTSPISYVKHFRSE